MPADPTDPGVYVMDLSSSAHPIVGVATSITAFVGRTVSGTPQQPALIQSFVDFDLQFGGLHADYPLTYAVWDFYQNGGSQAIIVRVTSPAASATLQRGGLHLVASSPGAWGNTLTASIDNLNITDEVAAQYELSAGDLFNLTVSNVVGSRTISQERFANLSFKPDSPGTSAKARSRRVDRVLTQSSKLVRLAVNRDGTPNLPAGSPLLKATATHEGAEASGTAGDLPAAGALILLTNHGDGTDDQALKPFDLIGLETMKTGIYALESAGLFSLLCVPTDIPGGDTDITVYQAALAYCCKRRAMLIVDPPAAWGADPATATAQAMAGFHTLGLTGGAARNAALYFPRAIEADPLNNGTFVTVPPCGMVAGTITRIDLSRAIWKAPAGIDAAILGINALQVDLTDAESSSLEAAAVNCLRTFPATGSAIWGARTMAGTDPLADVYKYIPVRRLALFLEESLYQGTQWVVFEPNDASLWASLRLNVESFLQNLFLQDAFQGQTPADAYFVHCDSTTNPQNQIDLGVVNIVVGFAPLAPAEFVLLKIQQIAGTSPTSNADQETPCGNRVHKPMRVRRGRP